MGDSKVIPFVKSTQQRELCGICGRGLTKETFTVRIDSEDGARRVTTCAPCGNLAKLPRERRAAILKREQLKKSLNVR